MPTTEVVFYMAADGTSPAYDALQALRTAGQHKAAAKCIARIGRLVEKGYELRRPDADYLRDGIYELRATYQTVNYRFLYFFHGRRIAVLSQLITKEDKVPDSEIDRAIANRKKFEGDPEKRTLRV